MAYNVSSAFREQLYSGESEFRAILTIGETIIDNDQIASISISSPIIDDSKQVFYVGTFISQKITIKFKNMDGIDVHSGDNVDLSIGQYVNNEWVDVPIGKFLVDDLAEDYYEKCEISCLDYAVKFKPNIDYSLCFTNGKATIKEILEYICDYFDVEIGDYPTINDDVEIGTYDSTVSGKQWISYIAELKGCNAKIDRLGRLTLQPLKQPSNVPINALESASFELGEEFNITKVTFFDAVRNYTYGDDEGNTLFIRQDNPFITDTKVVQNIYDNLCAIKYSASGKSFDIEDADAHPININTIYGETSQDGTPTPSSPQDINTVRGNNVLIIKNKNIFDGIYQQGGLDLGGNGGATSSNIRIRSDYISVKPSTTYTISSNNENLSHCGIGLYKSDKTYDSTHKINNGGWNEFPKTFTTESDTAYIRMSFRYGDGNEISPTGDYEIQLEQSLTATSYTPFEEQAYNIDLPVENLFDKNTNNTGFSESSTISTINNGLKITCTTSGTYRWYAVPLSNTNKLLGKKITITTDMTVSNNQNGQVALYFINKNNYSLGASIGSSGAKATGKITLSVDVPTTIPSGNTGIGLLLYSGLNQTSVNDYVNYDNIQIEVGSNSNTYTPYGTTSIELCKIGNYQDYIYKDSSKWYLHKEIGKVVLNTLTWFQESNASSKRYHATGINDLIVKPSANNKTLDTFSNIYIKNNATWTWQATTGEGIGIQMNGDIVVFDDSYTSSSDLTNFTTMLTNTSAVLYYPLLTPTNTEITYTPLIDQLNALQNAVLFEGTNHITIDTLNEVPTIDIDYYKNSHFNLWSLKTHNFGDFTLDAWDNIDYDLDGTHYSTLNNNTIKYEMSIMSDVESKIPTKQQEVTTNVVGGDDKTNIKKIKTNVDQLNASVNILSQQQTDTQTDVSQLQIDVNGINTTVEHIENVEITGLQSEISSVNQTVSSIANLFQITGGINKIRNSAFLLPDEVWEFTDSGTNPEHTNLGNSYNSTLSGRTISIAEIKARSTKIKSKSENITDLKTDGTKYTFNFYHKQDVDTTTTIKMYSTENNNIKAFNDIVITGQQPFTNYEVSFVPTYTNYTLEIIVANATSIGYAYLYDMMLNSGDKQPWQPASDEIYSTTLQMSRLGLQVYSVGDGTLTILGSDGLTSWETSDGRTKGRLVSKRTVDGDRVKVVTTQSVKLVSDATKTDEELAQEDKWVETTTKVSGKIAKVIYMESGVQ